MSPGNSWGQHHLPRYIPSLPWSCAYRLVPSMDPPRPSQPATSCQPTSRICKGQRVVLTWRRTPIPSPSPNPSRWQTRSAQARRSPYLSLGQALKAIVHHVDGVSLADADPHSRPDGSVHAGGRGTDVQDGQTEGALRGWGRGRHIGGCPQGGDGVPCSSPSLLTFSCAGFWCASSL